MQHFDVCLGCMGYTNVRSMNCAKYGWALWERFVGGANNDWALSLLGESELTSRYHNLDLLMFRLRLFHLLLVIDHPDEDSLIWLSPRDFVVFCFLCIPSMLNRGYL